MCLCRYHYYYYYYCYLQTCQTWQKLHQPDLDWVCDKISGIPAKYLSEKPAGTLQMFFSVTIEKNLYTCYSLYFITDFDIFPSWSSSKSLKALSVVVSSPMNSLHDNFPSKSLSSSANIFSTSSLYFINEKSVNIVVVLHCNFSPRSA